ncbi:hypothetical protein BGX20_006841 [Mortierella sp. AD010]|nr:hypothetical protein BGX20_006841 [Mortierella sp. AD010]
MDYGATAHRHNDGKQQGAEDVKILTASSFAGTSSSSNAAHGRNDYRHGSQDAIISADKLAPSVDGIRYRINASSGIDEKTALMNHHQPDQSVVVGGAFSDTTDSFVADILTPPLSLWVAGANLENSFFVLRQGRTPGKVYATYEEAQADQCSYREYWPVPKGLSKLYVYCLLSLLDNQT